MGLQEQLREHPPLKNKSSKHLSSEPLPGGAALVEAAFLTRAFFFFKLTSLTTPEFVYLSFFLPLAFSSLIRTNSMSSPASFRARSSPKDVVQDPISFGPFFDQWFTVIFKCLKLDVKDFTKSISSPIRKLSRKLIGSELESFPLRIGSLK